MGKNMIQYKSKNKIEGTRTTIDEELLEKYDVDPEKRDDWQEVQNYVEAINYGIERVKELPVCTRMIKEIHSILLKDVRGEHKNPGEYRTSQNWVGGSRPSNAVYVPPIPSEVSNCLGDLEKFINNENINTPELVKIAIIHYQFETIHPFLDGNGRTGRILIPIYLLSKGIINKPCFYISDYIEKNKEAYYDFLSRVRANNDIISWIKFFLEATIETAKAARIKFEKVSNFTKEINNLIMKLPAKSDNLRKVIDVLYNEPSVSRNFLVEKTGIKPGTVKNIIKILLENDIIVEKTGYSRNQVFSFDKYVNLFK